MLKNKSFLKVIFIWLIPASILTIVIGFCYAIVQQDYRQNANDPQIQMAEDGAKSLSGGSLPSLVVESRKIDISSSLAPFTIVYSDLGRPLESGAVLGGETPAPPAGVFAYAKEHGENRLTWEPEKGVRIAAVVSQFNGSINGSGFVLVGRSLREVEKREQSLFQATFLAWALCLIISFCGPYFVLIKLPRLNI